MEIDLKKAEALAKKEIQEEDFRTAVDQHKVKLRAETWWSRLFPFKIVLVRKDGT